MCVKYLAECLTLNENSMLAPGSIGFFFFILFGPSKLGLLPRLPTGNISQALQKPREDRQPFLEDIQGSQRSHNDI